MQINIGNNIVTGTAKEMADLMTRMGVQSIVSSSVAVSAVPAAPTVVATPGMGTGYTLKTANRGPSKSPVVTAHRCTMSTKQDIIDNYADILVGKAVTIVKDPRCKTFNSFQKSVYRFLNDLFPNQKFELCRSDVNGPDSGVVIFAA